MPLNYVNELDVVPCTYQSRLQQNVCVFEPPGRRDKFQRRDMRRIKREDAEVGEKEEEREAGCRQRKSTANSSNPRSLTQLGTIVMESLRQNLKRNPHQQQGMLLCQLLERLLYTIQLPLCLSGVEI